MLKIAIDSQPLIGQKTGIGQYVNNIFNILDTNNELELKYWMNQIVYSRYREIGIDEKTIINNRYPYKVIRRLQAPSIFHSFPIDIFNKFDIFHGTNFIAYNTLNAKVVLTIHDLAFLRYPEVADEITYRHHTHWLFYSIQKADHIIAISHQTKLDIMEFYNVPEQKISVIYLAPNLPRLNINDNDINFELPKKYFLFVGTLEPRKNIPFLIRGFALAKEKYGFEHKLVLVGKKGWKYEEIFQTIDELNIYNDIILLGYVTDMELSVIYQRASVFLFPSLYEGFGMPILEAMTHGIPVITSNISSMPEVVGDAAIKISPKNIEEFINAIGLLMNNEKIHAHYSKEGLKQSELFSWEKVGKETLDVYRKVLS